MRRWMFVAVGVFVALLLAGVAYVLVDEPVPTRDQACEAAIRDQAEVPPNATVVRIEDYSQDRFSANVFGQFDVRWPVDGPLGEHQAIYVCEVTPSGDVVHASTD